MTAHVSRVETLVADVGRRVRVGEQKPDRATQQEEAHDDDKRAQCIRTVTRCCLRFVGHGVCLSRNSRGVVDDTGKI